MARAGDNVRAFWKKIKIFFQNKPVDPAKSGSSPSEQSILDNDEHYDEYLRRIRRLDDIVVKTGLHERVSASQKYMYEMGRRDGSLGVKLKSLGDMALATARDTFGHIHIILKGKIAELQAELNAANNERDNADTLYRREQAYYDYVQFQYRFFPRSYSFLLFIIYFVIAIALIVADMPLALILIRQGFNLEGGTGHLRFPFLFQKGQFWNIIAANWQTTITAVGIALCTIYIKMYYDEFVGTPYANRLMTFRRFMEENGFTQSGAVESKVRTEHIVKACIKTVLVIFTIASIVILAEFRLRTAMATEHFPSDFFSNAAFVVITVLFPLIGGICLSHALNNIQNLTRMWKAKRKYEASRKKLRQAVRVCTVVEKNYNNLVAADDQLGKEKTIEEYKIHLIAFYERGYAIGGMQPEKYIRGEDFYSKILEWRNIAVSRKINNHISSLN